MTPRTPPTSRLPPRSRQAQVYSLQVPDRGKLFVPVPPPEQDEPLAYGAVYVSLCCDYGPVKVRAAVGAPGAWRWLSADNQSPPRWTVDARTGQVELPRGRVLTERMRRGDQGVAIDNETPHCITVLVEYESITVFDKNP